MLIFLRFDAAVCLPRGAQAMSPRHTRRDGARYRVADPMRVHATMPRRFTLLERARLCYDADHTRRYDEADDDVMRTRAAAAQRQPQQRCAAARAYANSARGACFVAKSAAARCA